MKKFFKNILQFSLVCILIYIVGLIAFGMYMPWYLKKNLVFRLGASGYLHSRVHDAEQKEKIDILFLGTSHSYRTFDPRIFDKYKITTFNLGSSGQSPLQTRILISQYLDQMKPKLVVYEVWPWFLGTDGVESAEDIIANDKIDFETLNMVTSVNHIRIYNSFIYAYFRQFFKLDEKFRENYRNKEREDTYIAGTGFVQKDFMYNKDTTKYKGFTEWNIKANQLEAFDDILTILKEKKIPYILVQVPTTSKFYNSKSNNTEMDKLFQTKGPYINYNNKVALNDSLHFYDDHHLNQDGIKIFNELFIQQIKKENLIQSLSTVDSIK